MPIYLGLLMGLMGSMHCIGMCGPLVMTIHSHKHQSILNQILYHSGKIFSYLVIGLIFGALGQTVHIFLPQQKLSLIVGLSMLVYFVLQYFNFLNSTLKFSFISPIISKWMKSSGVIKYLILGIGNGFLPCGLVYAAGTAFIASGHVIDSILFMLGFGLGTIPSLTGVIYVLKWIPERFRFFFNLWYKYLLLIIACLLILRGLNLGIPYLSPRFNPKDNEVHSCCHK